MNQPWMDEAYKHLGLRETKGPAHTAEILQFWKDIKRGGIRDDETPWCAAFVGAMLERVGIQSSRYESAFSYLKWGRTLTAPVRGCVGILARHGGGHVVFVDAVTPTGDLVCIGGNQSDEVNVRSFPFNRFVGWRYPEGWPLPETPLPVRDAETSIKES